MAKTYACGYTDDDGNDKYIHLDASRAAAGGFSAPVSGAGYWGPLHGKAKVRGVYGINGGGVRMFLPCATQSVMEDIWNTGSFAVVPYATFDVTGRRGERVSRQIPLP